MFTPEDYQRVITALPPRIETQLISNTNNVVLAGGFIRDTLLGLQPSDIDIFCNSEALAIQLASMYNGGLGIVKTDCSYTIMLDNMKIQYVYCRVFTTARSLIEEFDFTCCGVSLQYTYDATTYGWDWQKVDRFEEDTQARMLIFRCAEYNRGNLGALTRAFKFVAKGWYLPQKEQAKIVHHYIQPNFRRRTDNQRAVNVSSYGRNRSEAGRQVETYIDTLSESSRRQTFGSMYGMSPTRLQAYALADVAATAALYSVDYEDTERRVLSGLGTTQGSTTNSQEIGLAEVQSAVNPRYNPANRSGATNGE